MQLTGIEWVASQRSDGTWDPGCTSNPLRARAIEPDAQGRRHAGHFCVKVSEECAHCWASTFQRMRGTRVEFTPRNASRVELYLNEAEFKDWHKPKWAGKKVFPFDLTDLFYEGYPDEWVERCIDEMEAADRLTFLVLTKRPRRMVEIAERRGRLPKNVWWGVSTGTQRRVAERVPYLLLMGRFKPPVLFLSIEPLLGPIDLSHIDWTDALLERWQSLRAEQMKVGSMDRVAVTDQIIAMIQQDRHEAPALMDALTGWQTDGEDEVGTGGRINWVIAGGESNGPPKRRLVEPCDHVIEGRVAGMYYAKVECPRCAGTGWRLKNEARGWARSLRDACVAVGVPYFWKQNGGPTPKAGGALLDEREWREFPLVTA